MKLVNQGMLAAGVAGSDRAMFTFPTLLAMADGTLVATMRVGTSKECDDERIELIRSVDQGQSWSDPTTPFAPVKIAGHHGSLKHCYLTEIAPGRILAAAMWVDRAAHPGKPLFNPETEGCLPMAIVLCESIDGGQTFSTWRVVDLPDALGPPSLTSPILRLKDGRLAMSIETNKTYLDTGPWQQRAVLFHSVDMGATWTGPIVAAQDPTCRIFNWDLRCAVAPSGEIATFAWTYDSEAEVYRDIHRRISDDCGQSWTERQSLGFADQAGRPAFLPDGRIVLPWVDRFGSRKIKARVANGFDAPFDAASEITIFDQSATAVDQHSSTGDLLAEMEDWNFGLPYAETISSTEVMIVHYSGNADAMNIVWTRLSV